MIQSAWLIPLFPLLAFAVITAVGRRLRTGAAYIGIVATFGAFVLSLAVLWEMRVAGAGTTRVWEWLTVGERTITMGFEVNPLNALMLVIVSLVSFLVHVYSRGYMAGDERIAVFYQYLALFTFSMLGLVLSPNFLQLYIFWELVGVCSFLLIGFWYFKPEAKAAAKKAFLVTRVGDLGLFIGIALLFWWAGSFNYADVFRAAQDGTLAPWQITLACLLIFFGAMGKSGQFPLHTWLPDAMEGPTPVSALIHAATMVAAGVYLVAATFPLFAQSPAALDVVAGVGAFTALFAATIGLVQTDIKRVLAYSTVSQLGYMMLALGAAGYVAGIFHLMTHAFFKALLFLAAGAVIHAVHTQDIREMGGLFRRMKVTGTFFLIGCLAIAGVPPLSGFFSKDAILLAAWSGASPIWFWAAMATAFLTALYMFRLFFLVFGGELRQHHNAHEAPAVMTLPMAVLAVLAVVAGAVSLLGFGDWLTQGLPAAVAEPGHALWVMVLTTVVSLAGIAVAWQYYGRRDARDPAAVAGRFPGLYRLLVHKYYVDELYDRVLVRPLLALGTVLDAVDRVAVDGLVRAVAKLTAGVGRAGQRLQNGQLQTYGLVAVSGLVLLVVGLTLAGGYWR
ncbi:MAG: NADH-quinone oxidoreductase subunit L [Bacillota bacterium]